MQELMLARKIREIYSPGVDYYVVPETMGKSWTTPGIYKFIVPENVYFLCGVAIGAGGGCFSKPAGDSTYGSSGGGGGLGWKNRIPVVPGEELTIVVGEAGANTNLGTGTAFAGGDTYLMRGNTIIFAGYGGKGGGATGSGLAGQGGGYLGDGGGKGGDGIYFMWYTSGGAGAGGYDGPGGNPGSFANGTQGLQDGSGGGGSGGSGDLGAVNAGNRGGGTGLMGKGSNGVKPTGPNMAGGHGSYYHGTGAFGGGGSIGCKGPNSAVRGLNGGLRLIWDLNNIGRAFPSTNVGPM